MYNISISIYIIIRTSLYFRRSSCMASVQFIVTKLTRKIFGLFWNQFAMFKQHMKASLNKNKFLSSIQEYRVTLERHVDVNLAIHMEWFHNHLMCHQTPAMPCQQHQLYILTQWTKQNWTWHLREITKSNNCNSLN